MRLEQLYYIVEIADTGSFTASSERLFVSQPSISQSVNALEKELDVAIFKRSRSGAIPTEAGKLIIEHARAILNEINEIKSLSVQNDAELKGFLNVAAVPSMCYQILPCSIARFKAKYPNVHVRIWEGGSERIMGAVDKGDVDFGLVQRPDEGELAEKKLSFKPCIFSRLYALVSQDSPLAGRKSITYQELLDWQKKMILLRKKHTALRRGSYMVLAAEEDLFAFSRVDGEDRVTAAFNTGAAPRKLDLTESAEPVHIPPHSVKIIESRV